MNGNSVDIGSDADNIAAIDTGTTLLGGPTAAVTAFWEQIDGAQQLNGQNSGFWAFPCSTEINSTLAFGGTAWPISSADMNLGQIAQGFCMGAFFDVTQGAAYVPSTLSFPLPGLRDGIGRAQEVQAGSLVTRAS